MKRLLAACLLVAAAVLFTAGCQQYTSARCSADSGKPTPCTSPATYNNLSPGVHTFKVCARNHEKDDAGTWAHSAEGCDMIAVDVEDGTYVLTWTVGQPG